MQALQRGAWDEARDRFQESLAAGETPQALEQLGLAAWWLDDAALTFDARERAYRLYRDQGDPRGAARVATWLVWDHLAFRGDTAVASGWLERARRLLEGHEQTAEYGWLLLRDGEVALFRGHDPATARERGERAAALGRATGDRGLEVTGLALEGLARVSAGEVAVGLRRLDEATAAATGGEVKELHTVGVVCCWEIFACERVRDYDRAAQWCARVQEFTRRWRVRVLSAICRVQYAGVLIWRGQWAEAETELVAATRDFEQIRPPLTAQALARLGELRLRQGRLDEAAQLFERSGSQPIARIGQAALALERDAPEEAAAQLERFLAHVGDAEPTMRAVGYKHSLPIENAESLVDLEIEKPAPQGRDLLVEVKAISVNPVDTKVRKRAAPPAGETKILGYAAAGVVEAVGPEVTLFKAGDEVFYAGSILRQGTNSEFHLVDERIVGKKPKSLSFAQAAALPLTSITAWELLFDRLGALPGKSLDLRTLLITGGAGGVGSILIQLARRLTGLTVVATASREQSRKWCLDLGAHAVVEGRRIDFETPGFAEAFVPARDGKKLQVHRRWSGNFPLGFEFADSSGRASAESLAHRLWDLWAGVGVFSTTYSTGRPHSEAMLRDS